MQILCNRIKYMANRTRPLCGRSRIHPHSHTTHTIPTITSHTYRQTKTHRSRAFAHKHTHTRLKQQQTINIFSESLPYIIFTSNYRIIFKCISNYWVQIRPRALLHFIERQMFVLPLPVRSCAQRLSEQRTTQVRYISWKIFNCVCFCSLWVGKLRKHVRRFADSYQDFR